MLALEAVMTRRPGCRPGRKRHGRVVCVLVGLGVAPGVIGVVPLWAADTAAGADTVAASSGLVANEEPPGGACPEPIASTPIGEDVVAGIPTVESPETPQTRNLGTRREPVTFVTILDLTERMPAGVDSLNTTVGPFQRGDGTALEPEQIVADATVAKGSRRMSVRLRVCIDPIVEEPGGSRTIEAVAGSYSGTVLIDDPRVAGGAANYTVNLQYGPGGLVLLTAGLAWLCGAVGGVALATGLKLTELLKPETLVRALSALAASVGAAVTLVLTLYADVPGWEGDVSSFVRLALAVDDLLVREKAHTREGDAIAAARRRLPMVEVDATSPVLGPDGPVPFLDVFDGRDELLVYQLMWHDGAPFEGQCEGCTVPAWQLKDAVYLHARGVSFAILTTGPWDEVAPYVAFMGYTQPWYSVRGLPDPIGGRMGRFTCFLRDGDRAYVTYSTTGRGTEPASPSFALLDMTPYGRGEAWQDVPDGWPQGRGPCWYWRVDADGQPASDTGRPAPQWTRPGAGPVHGLGRHGHH